MIWIKNQDKHKKHLKTFWSITMTSVCIFGAVKFSSQCRDGIISGLSLCVSVLIPSLFIFMVIAQYVANSRLTDALGRLLSPITTKLLLLPKESSSALMLSLIGGYPIGARCIATLFKNGSINKKQAKKLSLIAVSSGPGFVVNFVGSALLNNKQAGSILLTSQIIAYFVIAVIIGRLYKISDESIVCKTKYNGTTIVEAVENGCTATINMCAMVISFSAIISVCESLLCDHPAISDAVACLLEVTTACNIMCGKYPLYLISFAIGFGGICVHFQVYSALKDIQINKFAFFLTRIIQGITASFITYILLILFPTTSEVFSTVENVETSTTTPLWGCCALILTAVCFLNSLSNEKLKRR
ncbi:MAG: hypothetical protein IJ275_02720 [Ruminococcus sp.]|nr:hypothetical protein [Ruminococcus sp.]